MPDTPSDPVEFCVGDFEDGQLWLDPDGDTVAFVLRRPKGHDRLLGSMIGESAWYNALTVGMALVADSKRLKAVSP